MPPATHASTPEACTSSAPTHATYGASSVTPISTKLSSRRARASRATHPTRSPTTTPSTAATTKSSTARPRMKLPVTVAATAAR